MLKVLFPTLLLTFLIVVASCGTPDQSSTGQQTPSTTEPAATPEEPAEKAPPAPAKLDPAGFTKQLPSSACDTIQRCKNEEMRGYVELMMAFMGSFGSLDKNSGLQPIWSQIAKTTKAENRFLLKQNECEPLLAKLLEINGMIGPPLEKGIESKSIVFNEDAATQCIENFKTVPTQCNEVKQLTEPLKMGAAEKLEKQFQVPLRDYLKSCGDAVNGTLEDGAACENDSQCKNGGCKRGEGETKVCKQSS